MGVIRFGSGSGDFRGYRVVILGFVLLSVSLVGTLFSILKPNLNSFEPLLPTISSGRPIRERRPFIAVDSKGGFRVSTGDIMAIPVATLDEVRLFAEVQLASYPGSVFELRIDENTEMRLVLGLLETLRISGVKRCSFLGVPGRRDSMLRVLQRGPDDTKCPTRKKYEALGP